MNIDDTNNTVKGNNSSLPVMTQESIDRYCEYLTENEYKEKTADRYKRVLYKFHAFLPDDKIIEKKSVEDWKKDLQAAYLSESTIQSYIIIVNCYLAYEELWTFQTENPKKVGMFKGSIMTREEYLHLLNTTVLTGKEKMYYIIKTLVDLGITVTDLQKVTVEAVNAGFIQADEAGDEQTDSTIRIPSTLEQELLSYARRHGITSGPLFLSRNGKNYHPVSISRNLGSLAHDACIDRDKVLANNLRRLQRDTFENMRKKAYERAELDYENLLERERREVGADNTYWTEKMRAKNRGNVNVQ